MKTNLEIYNMNIIISPINKMYQNKDIKSWKKLPRLFPYTKKILENLSVGNDRTEAETDIEMQSRIS